MGVEEYVDLDLDDFQRRSNERLLGLVDRHRASIERELGVPFTIIDRDHRIELVVGERPVYVASTTASGRLLLTDVSGRFDGRL
ncbi:MAG: hypothetical protein GEV08_16115 [Acidimicrobiia bacterium]|nr:hypothetical protein [Acidimicrobiia bacterium]